MRIQFLFFHERSIQPFYVGSLFVFFVLEFMSDDLKTLLSNLVSRQSIAGLLAVTVIDRQGVPIFQEVHSSLSPSEKSKSSAFLASSRFTSLGAQEAAVSNKRLGQGSNVFSVAFYQKYQSVQVIKHPISIIFLATVNANTGLILKKAKEFDNYFGQLQNNAKCVLEAH